MAQNSECWWWAHSTRGQTHLDKNKNGKSGKEKKKKKKWTSRAQVLWRGSRRRRPLPGKGSTWVGSEIRINMCVELEQFFWANFGLGAMLFLRLVTKHIPQQFPIQFQPFCARSLALLLSLSLATSLLSAGHVFTRPVLALACYFRLGHLIWFFLVTVFGYGLTKTTACSTVYVCRCVCVC